MGTKYFNEIRICLLFLIGNEIPNNDQLFLMAHGKPKKFTWMQSKKSLLHSMNFHQFYFLSFTNQYITLLDQIIQFLGKNHKFDAFLFEFDL